MREGALIIYRYDQNLISIESADEFITNFVKQISITKEN